MTKLGKLNTAIQRRAFRELFDQLERLHSRVGELEHRTTVVNDTTWRIDRRLHNAGILPISDREIVAKIFNGQRFYLDPRDLAVVPHLALDTVWEQNITQAWLRVLRPTDTVFDLGANFGYYGVIAAQKLTPKKSLAVMFEANPDLVPYIRKTLDVNWINEQARIENLAVADKPGEVTLHIFKDYLGSASLQSLEEVGKHRNSKMHLENAKAVTVKATSIDDYCQQHKITSIDLMKMDIEGVEDKAYAGMKQIVKNSPNTSLFIEFTPLSYAQPEQFYNELLQDFGQVYTIGSDGSIIKPAKTDYESIIGDSDDWVMPIFSKRSDLADLKG